MPRTRSQGPENALAGGQVKRGVVASPSQIAPSNKLPKRDTVRSFGDITNAISTVAVSGAGKEDATKPKPRPGRLHSVAEEAPARPLKALPPRPASLPDIKQVAEETEEKPTTATAVTAATVDPAPEHDYDATNLGQPNEAPVYAQDIFTYLRSRESSFKVTDYLGPLQPDLSKSMRLILIDWMVEIQENFELNHETLYLAVKLTDLYLGRGEEKVSKEALQLLGATALFVAAKFDERQPPCLDDFAYVCDDAYTRQQFLAQEIRLLTGLGFDLGAPLSYRFLRRYSKAVGLPFQTLCLARFVLETSLLHYEMIFHSESKTAAAALLLALRILRQARPDQAQPDWHPLLAKYSGYAEAELEPLLWTLNKVLLAPTPKTVTTIRDKYSHEVFGMVALLKPLDPPPVLDLL